ncbi:hypothetical protein ACWIG5_39305, partial [Streptomyces lydicus]
IQISSDFETVPPMTTAVLSSFPGDRSTGPWASDLATTATWSSSSGSTGEPSYYPRNELSWTESIEFYDRLLRFVFDSHQRPTLLVTGFAMGSWLGGTYTEQAEHDLRRRGHKISILTPGIDADSVIAQLSDYPRPYPYDQVVLAGYPPFVQDVLDLLSEPAPELDMRLLLAGESISEDQRDRLLTRIAKPASEPDKVCLLYGTACAGVMGHETPTTIAIRRLAHQDAQLRASLFGDPAVLPTFVEYDPRMRYTEVDADGRLLVTADKARLPLVRYRIDDEGKILTPSELTAVLRQHGHHLPVRTTHSDARFLIAHRRTDIAANFYGVKLYPDDIRSVLCASDLQEFLTGTFTLDTEWRPNLDQKLRLHVEVRAGAPLRQGIRELIRQRVTDQLKRSNSDYRQLHAALGIDAEPTIVLGDFGSNPFRYPRKTLGHDNQR